MKLFDDYFEKTVWQDGKDCWLSTHVKLLRDLGPFKAGGIITSVYFDLFKATLFLTSDTTAVEFNVKALIDV